MKKQAFYAKHRLTDAKPIDITRRPILAKDFADSVTDFLNSNFRGLVEVTHEVPNVAFYVSISSDMAAYFLKLMLAYVNGESLLKVNISTPEEDLVVAITAEDALPYDFVDTNTLIRTAKNAGFDVTVTDNSIIMKSHLTLSAALRVYALNFSDMRYKLNELFYTGGPIVTQKSK